VLVKTQRDGFTRTGLHIGAANARRFFTKGAPSIELRLDDLHIQCSLAPDFWQGHPEIHDPRLSEWLEFKVARRANGRDSLVLTMVSFGTDAFVLCPAPESRAESIDANVTHARKPESEPVLMYQAAPSLEERSVA
jgi:hypothetical protein